MSSAPVNRPTNVQERDSEINKKLQLYGIATAFKNGKVPSNEQIDIALSSFIQWGPISTPSTRLSVEGRELVHDFKQVLDDWKHLFLTKNEGNLLQDFIWQAQHIQGGDATRLTAPVDSTAAKSHGNQALDGLRTLGTLLVTNGQFRKLLSDATILLRDIAGDVAVKTATKVKPSDQQLTQIDQPAADNTWLDAPDISASQLKNKIKLTKSTAGDAASDAAGDASAVAHPEGSRDPGDTASRIREDKQRGRDSAVDVGDGMQAGAATLQQRTAQNVPEGTKESTQRNKDRARHYLSTKMPPERREQTIWRLRKMVIEIQGQSDYQIAIDTLLGLAETYVGHLGTTSQQSRGVVREAHTDSTLQHAEADLKLLLERFANGTSSDDLFDAINTLYRDADRDSELKSWFRQVNDYIRRCLKNQGYIMEDRATEEWNEIHDHGDYLLRERYRNHTDRIVDEVKFFADQFDKDPMNQRFNQSLQKLFKDLGTDEFGKATFKPVLVKDITEVIIPSALRSLHYVPIPRIEYSDPMIDAVVENLVIESDNLMPNIIEIANDNYFRFGRRNIANKSANSVEIHASGIQMDLRDVSYYVKRKQGTPKLTDLGVMDILLGGSGFSFRMKLSNAQTPDRQNFFKVDKVDVSIKNLNIKLKKSRHSVLFRLFKRAMLRFLRPIIQKVLESQIKEHFYRLDSMAFQIKKDADRAKIQARQNQENAPNIYERYINAAQKQLMQGKNKQTQKEVGEKKANIAMTKQDSIFPNLSLPGGISKKATEYKELGMQGEKWESPVFKLGSAPRSDDILPAPQVARKKHPVTQGGLRDRENIREGPSSTTAASDDLYGSDTSPGHSASKQLGAGATGATTAMNGTLTGGTTTAAYETGHTLLGENNPVYSGDA